ncbi:MAG: protein kinase, partial [Planctomycetes bacterium]|nr:protein kinase [Planctomycetota bacterium]
KKPGFVDQFIKEARAAGALNHPNIIQVHDVGTENGVHYFSMEFIDGPTCLHLLRNQGALSPGQTLEIGRQTAKALDYAHEHKLIHRDIKPDNIMLANGDTVKLADLGISKTFDEIENESTRKIVGTPHYIAPEAAKGQKVDHRIDLYSLGATLYHLITGRTPYQGSDPTDILKKLLRDNPEALQELDPDIPDSVANVIEKLMSKDPNDRYQNAAEVIKDIEMVQSSGDVEAKKPGDGETVILRRLAAGKTGDVDAGGDTNYTTNHTSGDVSHHSHTTMAGARSFNPVQIALIAIIVVAIAVIGVVLSSGSSEDTEASDPENASENEIVAPSDTTNSDISTSNNTGTDPEDSETLVKETPTVSLLDQQKLEREQIQKLDALDKEIRKASSSAELSDINRKLSEIGNEDLTRAAKKRATTVQKQLDRQIEQFQQSAASAAYKKLNTEVTALIQKQEFDTANQRIKAVQQQHGTHILSRINGLQTIVDSQRKTYFSSLDRKIKIFISNGDREGLQKLLKDLPPAILDTEAPRKINSAINAIDSKQLAAHKIIFHQAEIFLGNWQLSKTEEYYKETRKPLGNSPTGKAFDKLAAHVTSLKKMIVDVNQNLSVRKKFRGKIKHLSDPYIDGADEEHFHVRMDNGGKLKVRWKDIDRATFNAILTLGDVDPETYSDALSAQESAMDSIEE